MSTSDLHHMHTHKCTLKYIHTHFHTHAHTHAKNHMITLYGGIIQLRAMHTVCTLFSLVLACNGMYFSPVPSSDLMALSLIVLNSCPSSVCIQAWLFTK